MIRIDRGQPPPFFESDRYQGIKADLEEYFSDYSRKKRRSSYDFRPVQILQKEIRTTLAKRFARKCAYCEVQVDTTSDPHMVHYRPIRGARGFAESGTKVSKDARFLDNHYWWLSLNWDNLLIVCQLCNRFKASWFPLVDESNRAVEPGHTGPTIADEEPLLLDPCTDDPVDHLWYDEEGKVVAKTERGKVTIKTLNLNRAALIKSRHNALKEIESKFQMAATSGEQVPRHAIEAMAEVYSEKPVARPYLGIQRQFLDMWLSENRDVGDLVMSEVHGDEEVSYETWREEHTISRELDPGVEPEGELDFERLAIEKIELKNFRNIVDLSFEVPLTSEGGRAPWLVFLGENAVGKTTILQAIVLTLMGEQQRAEIPDLTAKDVLRYYREDGKLVQADEGWVKIWVSGSEEPLQLSFKKGDTSFGCNVPASRSYLIAYGSTRLLPDSDSEPYESPSLVRARNLFKASTPLVDANEWLFSLSEKAPVSFDMMVRGLREMLLMKGSETLEPDQDNPEKRRILIDLKNETTTLPRLSDGYRTILALASDMMSMLSRQGTSMEEAEGIVLIDEIGSNLHPRWKKRIVDCFRKVFPRIQFIVTTHEPLCLRGLYEHETVLLRRDYDDNIVAVSNLPNPQDLRVDELLASEFFGLSSTLETDLEDIYEEYYRLLIIERPNKAQRQRIAELKNELQARQHLGHGLRDELMYDVIDKLLARELRSPKPKTRQALKKETLEKVLQSWQEAGLLDDYMEAS